MRQKLHILGFLKWTVDLEDRICIFFLQNFTIVLNYFVVRISVIHIYELRNKFVAILDSRFW
jgi:hypothetical protein